MQKWEYLIVRCELTGVNVLKPRYVDNVEIPKWQQAHDVPNYIKMVGLEGWEMIHVHIDTVGVPGALGAMSTHSKETTWRMFFKRPLP